MRRFSAVALILALAGSPAVAQASPDHLVVGLFFASIEEGARIFTPVRLLPLDHPEAGGHQFPTVLQLHRGEFELLVTMGRAAGLQLGATLQRYPTQPDSIWPYRGFSPPPAEAFQTATVIHHPGTEAPLPGLRVVASIGPVPIGFIVDTRGLSLADRHMAHATTMGLDVDRAALVAALTGVAETAAPQAATISVFDR